MAALIAPAAIVSDRIAPGVMLDEGMAEELGAVVDDGIAVVSGGVVVLGLVVLGVVVLGLVVLLGDVVLGVMLEDGVVLLGDIEDGEDVELAEVSREAPLLDGELGTSLLTRWPLVTSPPEARVVRARRARVLSVVVPVRVLSLAVPVRGVVPVVGCWACAASAPPTASAAASARALSGAFRTRMCSSF